MSSKKVFSGGNGNTWFNWPSENEREEKSVVLHSVLEGPGQGIREKWGVLVKGGGENQELKGQLRAEVGL